MSKVEFLHPYVGTYLRKTTFRVELVGKLLRESLPTGYITAFGVG